MSEEQINLNYIKHKLKVDLPLAKEILKLCSERYIDGLEQSRFDKRMLEHENNILNTKWTELENWVKAMLEVSHLDMNCLQSVLCEMRRLDMEVKGDGR